MRAITLLPGTDKNGTTEPFSRFILHRGEMVAIVGGTGSGKSRLIKDIEQLALGDTVTGRRVLVDGEAIPMEQRMDYATRMIAHLGQNMRFVLDNGVEEFLKLHIACRHNDDVLPAQVIELANKMTPECICPDQNLTTLSGGQTRALMIADVSLVCRSPVVLVDEIENAGVDKRAALDALTGADKIILVVTHDPHTALLCGRRIRMQNGAVTAVVDRTAGEADLLTTLEEQYVRQQHLQTLLRKGVALS